MENREYYFWKSHYWYETISEKVWITSPAIAEIIDYIERTETSIEHINDRLHVSFLVNDKILLRFESTYFEVIIEDTVWTIMPVKILGWFTQILLENKTLLATIKTLATNKLETWRFIKRSL